MPIDEDEEEYLDSNCPTGKLVKKLEEKCKKPVVDDSFGKILDEFRAITSVQDRYLVNGIFQIDFAQSALFIQSASIYYSKRVDKLWDELLEFHARLVQYDHHHAKEIKDSTKLAAKENELHKIEDRLNRGRRKKVQLVEIENQRPTSSGTLDTLQEIFGESIEFGNEEDEDTKRSKLPFEPDDELIKSWKSIFEAPKNKWKKVSKAVWEHGNQSYKLNNYEIYGKDFHIMDLDDEDEFNVKYSNAPTYHILKHLFEYNDRCLLPDQQNTIATLRLGYNLTNKYLADNHIPLGTPYEVYKEGYERFVKDYYHKEKRRIQNLPQSSTEDLQNFYKILIHREKEALQAKSERKKLLTSEERMVEPSVTFLSLIEAPLCDNELKMIRPTFENECSDAEVSGLLEGKEKDNDANRLDSGIMTLDRSLTSATSGFFSNDEENQNQTSATSQKEAEMETESSENPAETTESSSNEKENNNENVLEDIPSELTDKQLGTDSGFFDTGFETDDEDEGDETVEPLSSKAAENNEETTKNSEETSNVEKSSDDIPPVEEENSENDQNTLNKTKPIEKLKKTDRKIQKQIVSKQKPIKRIHKEDPTPDDDDSPSKRRKLTLKAIEKLSKSLVDPVKELKWEKFFSMTYEPEVGEGVVQEVQYESEPEPESDLEATMMPPPPPLPQNDTDGREENITPPPPSDAYHSDHDYATMPSPARSECPSDHDYALPAPCAFCGGNTCEKCKAEEERIEIGGKEKETEKESVDKDGVDEFVRRVEKDWDVMIREEIATPLQPKEYGPLTKADQELKDYEEERAKSRKRVEEWKERIIPILRKKKAEEFDIHEYGSKIMDSMEVDQSRLFSYFVGGKEPSEVAKFFVSALQLANMSNIEIGGSKKGDFSNETFTLKLVSKERYHDHLNEFMAPSEETFRERLERVREMNKRMSQSTFTQPPLKKLKIVLNRPLNITASRRLDFNQDPPSPVKRQLSQQIAEPQLKKLRIIIDKTESEQNRRYSSADSGIESCGSSQRSDLDVLSQPSTSRSVDFESSQQMGPPQPIFDDVMSWKAARMQRRSSSTADSGIMQSPMSEDAFRDSLRVSLDGGTDGKVSTPQKEF